MKFPSSDHLGITNLQEVLLKKAVDLTDIIFHGKNSSFGRSNYFTKTANK